MGPVARTILLLACCWLAAPAAAQSTDIEVELDQFGVGSAYRPGDFAGVRVKLTSHRDEPATPVWVQLEVPNADGDIGEYGRSTTLNRETPKFVWLYAPLPANAEPGSVWTIRVFEERDGRRRQELGGSRVAAPPGGYVEIAATMVGIVSETNTRMGLDSFAVMGARAQVPVASHEPHRVIAGITPLKLPDRWEGLKCFEALVWSEANPSELREETAAALVEYVRRGGHLVIVLPDAGNPWGFGDSERIELELESLLPATPPRREDGVPLATLVPVLAKSRGVKPGSEFDVSINVFRDLYGDFDTIIDGRYDPLIALPDGRVVVVQRTVGFGRITICGLNIASGQLNSVPLANGVRGLPQGDAFWNRILGRRCDTPSIKELGDLEDGKLLASSNVPTENDLGGGRLIAEQIGMTRQAGIGLFLAFLLFIAYWIVAGPGGHFLLKQLRQVQHAWLAFAAASGVFTALAWGIVTIMPQDDVTVRHVTYLDHIARPDDERRPEDPQYQRAVSWFSVLLPDYRDTPLAIDPGAAAGSRDLLAPWWPPGVNVQTFPNVDRYLVDVGRSPADFAMPGRSTTTQMQAFWLGSVDRERFGSFLWVDPDDPIRIVRDASGREDRLRGTIAHQLPGPLSDVSIIWVKNLRAPRRLYERSGDKESTRVQTMRSGTMLNLGNAWRRSSWEPNQRVLLSEFDPRLSLLQAAIQDRYVGEYLDRALGIPGASSTLNPDDRSRYMDMLSFFSQLTPPRYFKQQASDQEPPNVRFYRQMGRELDLSSWFTRPCLIIIGTLYDAPCPVPLLVDGERPLSEGVTIVRWIHPLPVETEIAFPKDVGPQ